MDILRDKAKKQVLAVVDLAAFAHDPTETISKRTPI
jgi:hypothetical protein